MSHVFFSVCEQICQNSKILKSRDLLCGGQGSKRKGPINGPKNKNITKSFTTNALNESPLSIFH